MNLEENFDYTFSVSIVTSAGAGPSSMQLHEKMPQACECVM
jgi:hypothetical protein